MPTTKPKRARRAMIKRDKAGKFRYTVQGGNWKVIDDPEQGFARKTTVTNRIATQWPHCEEIIDLTVTPPTVTRP